MITARATICWAVVILLGFGLSAIAARFFPTDVNSVILVSTGVVGTVASGFAWALIRKFDELKNVPGLDRDRREILAAKIDARRAPMIRRWVATLLFGILAVGVGQILKSKTGQDHETVAIFIGYTSATLLTFCSVLLVVEFTVLSRLGPNMSRDLAKAAADRDFLEKVRA